MKRQQGIIEWAMHYYQITLLVLIVLVGLGNLWLGKYAEAGVSEFTIRQGVVVVFIPGRLLPRWRNNWQSLWNAIFILLRR